MRAFGFLCLLVLIGTAAFSYHGYCGEGSLSSNPAALIYHGYSSKGSISSNAGIVSKGGNAMASVLKSRKLKEATGLPKPDEDESPDHFSLQDYRQVDPSPSSKAAIRPGPIQHGTPLMPYIPNPSPAPGKPHGP